MSFIEVQRCARLLRARRKRLFDLHRQACAQSRPGRPGETRVPSPAFARQFRDQALSSLTRPDPSG